jgi:hypothetical protein
MCVSSQPPSEPITEPFSSNSNFGFNGIFQKSNFGTSDTVLLVISILFVVGLIVSLTVSF